MPYLPKSPAAQVVFQPVPDLCGTGDALVRSMYEPHTKTSVTIKSFDCSNAIETHGRIYSVPFLGHRVPHMQSEIHHPIDANFKRQKPPLKEWLK